MDGRDGAYGMTLSRVLGTSTIPEGLLVDCKEALLINDSTDYDNRIKQLINECIYDFEKITGTSVLPVTITVNYEYFKGKNKLPHPPHVSVTPVNGFTVTGGTVKYVDGGNGEAQAFVFTAGYTQLPLDVKSVIIKMVECRFKDEWYHAHLIRQIQNFTIHL